MKAGEAPRKAIWRRLASDRFAIGGMIVIGLFALIALLSASGLWRPDYLNPVGPGFSGPAPGYWFGTDLFGRDVLAKLVHGAEVAFSVGLVASLIAIPIGAVFGSLAGYFGGRLDDGIVWLYTTVASIPQFLLLTSLSYVLGRGLTAVYLAIGLTWWIGTCRIIRSEVIKLKSRDYVRAARALGAGNRRILFQHISLNVIHLLIIDFSLCFIHAIKFEVILSYLNLGIQGAPSWGVMIADAKEELIQGIWWPLAGATGAMFLLVLAFNLVGDALRDTLDPRLVE